MYLGKRGRGKRRRSRLRRYRGARFVRAGRTSRITRATLVLAVGATLGLLLSASIFANIRKGHLQSFAAETEHLLGEIQHALDGWETAARSFGNLWVDEVLDGDQLANHVQEVDLAKHVKGLRWLALFSVRDPARPSLVFSTPELPDHLPEELFSDPAVAEALREAEEKGETVVSRRFHLRMEGCDGAVVAILRPIYRDGDASAVQGWIASGICLESLFSHLVQKASSPMGLAVTEDAAGSPVFETGLCSWRASLPQVSVSSVLRPKGAEWTMTFSRPAFPLGWQAAFPVLLLFSSIGASLLLSSLTNSEARERFLAEEMMESFRVSQRQARFLADASRLLASQTSTDAVLRRLAERAIPLLGPGCGICLLDGDEVRILVAHADKEVEREMGRLFCGTPLRLPEFDAFLLDVHQKHVRRVPGPLLEARLLHALAPENREAGRQALRWCLLAPMIARGRPVGALVVRMRKGVRYGPKELGLIHDFASRIAMALDNARLLSESKRSVRIRDEFLSVASHELLTPLTALQAQIQSLLRFRQDGQFPPERLGRGMEVAERQVQRLTKLVRELLDVSRIEAGKMVLQREAFDVSDLLMELWVRYRVEAERVGSALTIDVPPGATGLWDRHRIEQVITNLLSNAIKYGNGGPIHVRVERDDAQAKISVRDEGIGIPKDSLRRIFTRFERVAPDKGYGGLGLGLFIANQIVEAHGGRIDVESTPGQGSTFTVVLSRGTPGAALGPAHPSLAPEPGR